MTAKNFIDETGKTFGRWTVVEYAGRKGKKASWRCRCECGNEKVVLGYYLRSGESSSCGCYNRDVTAARNYRHGQSDTKLYDVWTKIIARCENQKDKAYPWYGGRGVSVCSRWRNSFTDFAEDMGEKPTPRHTVERVDTNGNYCPENCVWATYKQQARNTRRNHLLTCLGETKCIAEWAEITGIKYSVIHDRISRGWPPEKAFGYG